MSKLRNQTQQKVATSTTADAKSTEEQTATTQAAASTETTATAESKESAAPANETKEVSATQEQEQGTTTKLGEVSTDLLPHQELELRAFCEHLDEYEARFEYRQVAEAIDIAAHRKLHAAIRMFLRYDEVVMKEAFAAIVKRMSTKHQFNAFGMPTLVRHLHTDQLISSSTERVFIAEFLSILSQYARTQKKQDFRKVANLERTLSAISDPQVRSRIDSLFPR